MGKCKEISYSLHSSFLLFPFEAFLLFFLFSQLTLPSYEVKNTSVTANSFFHTGLNPKLLLFLWHGPFSLPFCLSLATGCPNHPSLDTLLGHWQHSFPVLHHGTPVCFPLPSLPWPHSSFARRLLGWISWSRSMYPSY